MTNTRNLTITLTPRGRVHCSARIHVPASAGAAWGQLRDFRRFAAQDFFHAAVRVDPGGVRRGASLKIDHRFGPFAVTRVGRILQWQEGRGYSFSDLSRRNRLTAFPHVYRYRLLPAGPSRCVLEVTVSGRWTTPLLPRWAARLWLAWVFTHIAASVRNTLLALLAAAPRPAFGAAQTNSSPAPAPADRMEQLG